MMLLKSINGMNAMTHDLVIRGGTIADGSGAACCSRSTATMPRSCQA
jgi:hypothetical protein